MFKKCSMLILALALTLPFATFTVANATDSANDGLDYNDDFEYSDIDNVEYSDMLELPESRRLNCTPYVGRVPGGPANVLIPGTDWCVPPAPTAPYIPECIPWHPTANVSLPSNVPGEPGSAWCFPGERATEPPTDAPTTPPTDAPTTPPTDAPTTPPTDAPTTPPTDAPTTPPTVAPTAATEAPTAFTTTSTTATEASSTPELLPQTGAAINTALMGAGMSFVTAGSTLVIKNKRK